MPNVNAKLRAAMGPPAILCEDSEDYADLRNRALVIKIKF